MKEIQTLEELLISQITNDEGLAELLRTKIKEVIVGIDFGELIAPEIKETIQSVFENDEIYSLVEDALKQEVGKALTAHFEKK